MTEAVYNMKNRDEPSRPGIYKTGVAVICYDDTQLSKYIHRNTMTAEQKLCQIFLKDLIKKNNNSIDSLLCRFTVDI